MEITRMNFMNDEVLSLLLLADPSETIVRNYFNDGYCYVVRVEKQTIGVVIWIPLNTKEAEVKNIAIYPEFQGKGYGKHLLQHVCDKISELNYEKVWIGTGNSSINQLALYQKCGFRMSYIKKDFFIENYDEKIIENSIWCRDMIMLEKVLQKR